MKRFISIAALLACTTISIAQLRVNSNGSVSILNTISSSGTLTLQTNSQYDLRLRTLSSRPTVIRQVYSTAYHNSGQGTYLFHGVISNNATDSDTPGTSIGIYSRIDKANPYATVNTPGVRYGLCGINVNYGAAVFGSTSSSNVSLNQPYAGYFVGDTHVQGNLSVSGNVSGVMLTPSPISDSMSGRHATLLSREQGALSSKLEGLTATAYYYDSPNITSERLGTSTATKDKSTIPNNEFLVEDGDSIDMPEEVIIDEAELPLNAIGKQIYAKQHYSLSADELEAIFPDLVYENEDGSKSINYVEMVPILVQAIGELSAKVAVLEGKDGAVRKVAAKTTGINDVDGSVEVLALGQNKPNPFGTSTEIEVSVPESVQSAFVYVYDLQGKKVQQVNLTARGRQTVQLNATSLSDGMYLYSLIADGKVVETRRMIVEK